jgi:hypothetical protein
MGHWMAMWTKKVSFITNSSFNFNIHSYIKTKKTCKYQWTD